MLILIIVVIVVNHIIRIHLIVSHLIICLKSKLWRSTNSDKRTQNSETTAPAHVNACEIWSKNCNRNRLSSGCRTLSSIRTTSISSRLIGRLRCTRSATKKSLISLSVSQKPIKYDNIYMAID